MTPAVSTLGRDEQPILVLVDASGRAVTGRVVGRAVLPAAEDHPDPGAGQDAHGAWVVGAATDGIGVDPGGPRAGVAAVVGERCEGVAEAGVQ